MAETTDNDHSVAEVASTTSVELTNNRQFAEIPVVSSLMGSANQEAIVENAESIANHIWRKLSGLFLIHPQKVYLSTIFFLFFFSQFPIKQTNTTFLTFPFFVGEMVLGGIIQEEPQRHFLPSHHQARTQNLVGGRLYNQPPWRGYNHERAQAFRTYEARLASFSHWSPYNQPQPHEIADGGVFLSGLSRSSSMLFLSGGSHGLGSK